MPFTIRKEQHQTSNGIDGTIHMLEDPGRAGIEVWPAFGFNCIRWYSSRRGHVRDWLYSAPTLFEDTRPTRSGIPILFPFPNRIRDGKFHWQGKSYELPINDPDNRNTIHGFACRNSWRIIDTGTDDHCAWIRGAFDPVLDAPDCVSLWPAKYVLEVEYRISVTGLKIEAVVTNPDVVPLPFGIGYHPYFRMMDDETTTVVQVSADKYWPLQETLPGKSTADVDAARDFRNPKNLNGVKVDDILTGLPTVPEGVDLQKLGTVSKSDDSCSLEVFADTHFRELVLFIPPHREAVCLEPYTCTTDAIHLQQEGVDAGWMELAPGNRWVGVVELRTHMP